MVLQHIVERELDRTMRRTGARAASGILIDPTTGHVLALANRPAADPNHYGSARDRERINRALAHSYEPGSTFKPVPLAAALDRGTVRSDSPIFCENGVYRLGKRRIHDVSPHKTLTPGQILEHSSNIGIVKVALTLGARDLRQSIVDFGFGARTGIELPGESPGLLAPVPRWSDFTHASLAFGQEIGVTALQMTSAIAAIANDGVLQPPRVVLGARDANGEFERFAPAEGQRVLAEGTAQQLQSFLRGVVERGTGTRAKIPGYRLAGKSGTAQKAIPGGYSETEYFASFVGFGPADTPRLAGLVLLDSPRGDRHQGGQVAAPAFGRIMQDALRYLRAPHDVEPPRPTHVLQAAQRASSGSATKIRTDRPPVRPGFVPDVRGLSLRQAAVTLSANGCRPEVNGRGRVTSQRPSAGARLPEDGICFVGLQDERGRAVSPPAGRARL
jgi:cell division protein FtsI/penicillin-binding protein 2